MSRTFVKLVLLTAILGISWFIGQPGKKSQSTSSPTTSESRPTSAGGGDSSRQIPTPSSGASRQTWGHIDTLPDHFARHGRDFHARDADDYAAQAAAFLERARKSGLPAKRDADGSLRVFDPATGAFGAYNANGTTKTFFKPGDRSYFDRQPGESVDLRTAR